jgi:hypothetical protein
MAAGCPGIWTIISAVSDGKVSQTIGKILLCFCQYLVGLGYRSDDLNLSLFFVMLEFGEFACNEFTCLPF